MTPITKRNRPLYFELQTAQPTSIPEGPIKIITPEILEYILVLTNQSETTQWVSREWKGLTLSSVKYSKKPELTQTIQLIIEKLNPYKNVQCITNFAILQNVQQSFSDSAATLEHVHQYFLGGKSLVVCFLRRLPENERNQLQNAIGPQLPNSMKNVFEISKLDIRTVKNVDLDTFLTLLQSDHLSKSERGEAAVHAAFISNFEYVALLLANGPISDKCLTKIIWQAAAENNLEFLKWVLANGLISAMHLGMAVWAAAEYDYPILVKWLLTYGPISELYRGCAVVEAARSNNLELVKLLLADGPISKGDQAFALDEAIEINNPELIQVLSFF